MRLDARAAALALSLLPALFAASGCDDDDDWWGKGDPRREWEPPLESPDADPADAACEAEGEGSDAAERLEPQEPIEPAVADPPVLDACVAVETDQGFHPSLRAAGGRLYLFYSEPGRSADRLLVRTVGDDGALGEPATVLYGARGADLVAADGGIRALASRQFYKVELDSTPDAADWTEGDHLAQEGGPYACTGYEVGRYFLGAGGRDLVALGFEYNDGIFGCHSRVFFARREAGAWTRPAIVGNGAVAGAAAVDGRLCIVGTSAVWTSDDGGQSFGEVPDGDTTADQLKGSGLTLSAGRLLLVQRYDWASLRHIAVVASEDGGRSWPERRVLLDTSGQVWDPVLASAGERVLLVYTDQAGHAARAMVSPDAGRAWSAAIDFSDAAYPVSSALAVAATSDTIAVAYASKDQQSEVVLCRGRWTE